MANLLARYESLLEQIQDWVVSPVIVISMQRPDRFTFIGTARQATQQEIKQALQHKPPTFNQRQLESDLVPRPVNSRKKQHIPSHGK